MRVKAYFYSLSNANKVKEELNKMGIKSFIDIIDKYADTYNDKRNIAGTVTGPSLASLVLKSGYPFDIRKSPLMMSDPMISGIGDYEEVADFNIQLNIDVTDDKIDSVSKIVNSYNGLF